MICPKCNLNTLSEEKDMVVCSNCGFKATVIEYNMSKHILRERPRRRIEPRSDEGQYSEAYRNIEGFLNDKYIQTLVFVILLLIVFVIITMI